jgi:hypothetical protein
MGRWAICDATSAHGRCQLWAGHTGEHLADGFIWPEPRDDRLTGEELSAIRDVLRSPPPGVPGPRHHSRTRHDWPPQPEPAVRTRQRDDHEEFWWRGSWRRSDRPLGR